MDNTMKQSTENRKLDKLQIYHADERLIERRPGFQSFQSFNFANNFRAERIGKWQLQVSPNQEDSVLHVKQNIYAYRGSFKQGERVKFEAIPVADVFLVPLSGAFKISDQSVGNRDSAEFITKEGFEIAILQDADLWLMVQPHI
jgi:redox-sensitive bicupin YhaK (pirin superfamily)